MSGIFFGSAGAAGTPAPITVSSNWGSTGPGASPQTSPTRTLTVPALNPGSLYFSVTGTGASSVTVSQNSGTFTSLTDGGGLTVANGDTLAFKLTGASRTATIAVTDTAAATSVGSCTLTNS